MLSSDVNAREFTFRRSGAYSNAAPLPRPRRVAGVRRDAGWGKICIACGIARSCADVCECNAR